LRNLHDICFALGAGADAVSPYAMYKVALRDATDYDSARKALRNTFAMRACRDRKGRCRRWESTRSMVMGGSSHRSVFRRRSPASLASNYRGSDEAGLTLARLDLEMRDRLKARRTQAAKSGVANSLGRRGCCASIGAAVRLGSSGQGCTEESVTETFIQKLAEIEAATPGRLAPACSICRSGRL
jgi:glutamate synthase (NADPH/NADH) large chain